MRWRPFGLLLVVATLLASGCSDSGGATTARYGCFRFHLQQAQPTPDASLAADVVATNITRSSCAGPHCGGVTGRFVVTNSDGREVEHEGGAGVMCQSNAPPPVQVRPGASVVWDSIQWDGIGDVTSSKPKPGRYRVTWSWLDAVYIRSAWIHTSHR
jgi:hypothetical protein